MTAFDRQGNYTMQVSALNTNGIYYEIVRNAATSMEPRGAVVFSFQQYDLRYARETLRRLNSGYVYG